jgi:mannan endo-1,4-beta-mannosidase
MSLFHPPRTPGQAWRSRREADDATNAKGAGAPRTSRMWRVAVPAFTLLVPALSGCAILPSLDRHGADALADGDDVLLGAWLGSWPSDENPAIDRFEDETGVRLDLVDVYLDWRTPFANVSHTVRHISEAGAVPILTWEAQTLTTPQIIDGTRVLALRDGSVASIDEYLADFAAGACKVARSTNQPILVRVLHEMNGGWFAWGIGYRDANGNYPNTEHTYREAFAKIHDAFGNRCGSRVKMVWAVNHYSEGPRSTYGGTYPGDKYVDFVGLDGYNWGTRAPWGWQSFDTIFHDAYCAVTLVSPKPVLIAETASSEAGGNKAQWIRTLFDKADEYERIRGIVYFNDAKHESEVAGGMDWPIESSNSAMTAYSEEARLLLEERGVPNHDKGSGGGPC